MYARIINKHLYDISAGCIYMKHKRKYIIMTSFAVS